MCQRIFSGLHMERISLGGKESQIKVLNKYIGKRIFKHPTQIDANRYIYCYANSSVIIQVEPLGSNNFAWLENGEVTEKGELKVIGDKIINILKETNFKEQKGI